MNHVQRALAALVALGVVSLEPAHAQQQDLSSQATDPTASLMAFNLINDFQTSFYDRVDGTAIEEYRYEFRFQPVVPFQAFGASNILRVVVPFQVDGLGDEGLKSVSIFDLVILPRSWGRVGIGPVMSLAESSGSAPSKLSIGPAIGAVAPVNPRLSVGLFNQNLFGDHVAITQLQPVVAYQLGDGWALSAGDLQFVYDWEGGQVVSIPIGFQLGKVQPVFQQPFRFSVNPQYNLRDLPGSTKLKILFTVTLLAPAG